MNVKALFVAVLMAAAFGTPATGTAARDAGHSATETGITSEAFELQAAKVRKQMEPPGRYSSLNGSQRRAVEDQLALISVILKKRGSSQAMTGSEKVDVFNMQERINALLAGRDDYQICKVDNQTGTHFKSKVCVMAGDVERLRIAEIQALDRMYGLHGLGGGGKKAK